MKTKGKARNRQNPKAPAVSQDGRYAERRGAVKPTAPVLSLFLVAGRSARLPTSSNDRYDVTSSLAGIATNMRNFCRDSLM